MARNSASLGTKFTMADLTTSGPSTGNLSFDPPLPREDLVPPNVKTESSALVAADAQAGEGARPGATASAQSS